MKFTSVIPAALLLAGAGGIIWWQHARTDKHLLAASNNPGLTSPHIRTEKAARDSRFQSLTDPSVRWQVRVDMLRRLDAGSLGQEDINTLYSLLKFQPAADQEENWWVVVNEIMEQMRLQAIAPERYANELLAIIRNPSAPDVLRDYAVQHLGRWCSPRGAKLGHPSERNPAIVRETVDTFAALVTDPSIAHTSIPGTTLMLLVDMKGGGVPEEIINPAIKTLEPWFATTITGNNNTGKITRISAINAIGMLALETFRPDIRSLATNESVDPSIRLNSIAALGQIGEPSDLAALQAIATSDSRLRFAAQAAFRNLTAILP